MSHVDDATARAYRAAWEAWIKQADHVHRVFLDGEPIEPAQLKGLLNREVRAWESYVAARRALLGLGVEPSPLPDPDANPFR